MIVFGLSYYWAFYKILNKEKFKFIAYSIIIGSILFFTGLLILYLFKFSEYEAINLAAMKRYTCIYFIAMLTILVFILLFENNIRSLLTLLIILAFLNPLYKLILLPSTVNESIVERNKYQQIINLVSDNVNKNKKIYIISQGDQGYDYWVLRFSIRPIYSNSGCWSLGTPYYIGDIWTCEISSDEYLKTLINEYDYVLVYKSNSKFTNEFGNIFGENIQSNTLYRIDKEKRSLIKINSSLKS